MHIFKNPFFYDIPIRPNNRIIWELRIYGFSHAYTHRYITKCIIYMRLQRVDKTVK